MEELKRFGIHFWGAAKQGKLPVESETAWFILVSALDFAMTYIMLQQEDSRFVETNPIALFFINHWGIKGLFAFKLAIVLFVALICQIIAHHNRPLARRVLFTGTAIVASVVVYSIYLHQTSNQIF